MLRDADVVYVYVACLLPFAQLLFDRRDEIERKRAKLSGAIRVAEYEQLVTGLPKARREAIEQEKRRLAFAPPLTMVVEEERPSVYESVDVAGQVEENAEVSGLESADGAVGMYRDSGM